MRFLKPFCLAFAFMAATSAQAADQTIIVLDASGSMWGQIEGTAKMDIARETLDTVLSSVPAENALGLMVYGHREKGSCTDIELAVPPAPGTAEAISKFVKSINPKGKTPLSESVKQAAEALKYTEEKATVILVTDGLETCEADPCALGSELESVGVDFTAHVVGFGLTDEEGKQVACLAENTGGKYLQAKDAAELSEALTETVVAEAEPAPEPEPAKPDFNVSTDAKLFADGPSLGDNERVRWDFYPPDANGAPSEDGVEGGYGAASNFNLPSGKYVGVARLGALSVTVPFEVAGNDVARPVADFNAGLLTVIPKRTPDGEPDDNVHVDLEFAGNADGGYGLTKTYVTAGEVKLTGRIGPSTVEQTITIAAGEEKTHEIVIGGGIVVTKAIYAEGGPAVEDGDIRFDVIGAKPKIDGSRDDINGGYGVDDKLEVPTGDFILRAQLGSASGETPFSMKAGESIEVSVNINAGVLAIAAPGAYRIDIIGAKKDIQGKRKDISGNYGEEYQDTLPPGDYLVRVEYEGDKAPQEKPATVVAGERTEVTVD